MVPGDDIIGLTLHGALQNTIIGFVVEDRQPMPGKTGDRHQIRKRKLVTRKLVTGTNFKRKFW